VGNTPTGNVLPAGEELVNSGLERPSIGSLYRTRAGFGKKADSRSCDDLEKVASGFVTATSTL
jgi:hypothetical protein